MYKPPTRDKEQSIVDTYWSESTTKNKLLTKAQKRIEHARNISQFQVLTNNTSRIKLPNKKNIRSSVVMIEENVEKPVKSAFKDKFNLPLNTKNLYNSLSKTVLNSRKNSIQAKGVVQDDVMKTNCNNLKERLKKITLELDRVISKKVNDDEKVRRTRKERTSKVLNKTSVMYNSSLCVVEPDPIKYKKSNRNTKMKKTVKKLNIENEKLSSKQVENYKNAQHRCHTRIEKIEMKKMMERNVGSRVMGTKQNKG